jgi:hypothetical protein
MSSSRGGEPPRSDDTADTAACRRLLVAVALAASPCTNWARFALTEGVAVHGAGPSHGMVHMPRSGNAPTRLPDCLATGIECSAATGLATEEDLTIKS